MKKAYLAISAVLFIAASVRLVELTRSRWMKSFSVITWLGSMTSLA